MPCVTDYSSLIHECFLFTLCFKDGNEYEELNNIEETSIYNNKQFKPESPQRSSSENRTKPIMIMDLWSTIHKLEKHSNIGFEREFKVSILTYIQEFQFGLLKCICIITVYVSTTYSTESWTKNELWLH